MYWFILIANTFLVFFSIYIWKRYKDKNYLWLFILNILALVLDTWKLLNLTPIINGNLVIIFWVAYLMLTLLIVFKSPNKKV